jgi:hypothetical protein
MPSWSQVLRKEERLSGSYRPFEVEIDLRDLRRISRAFQ